MRKPDILLLMIFTIGLLNLNAQTIKSIGIRSGSSITNQNHKLSGIDFTIDTDNKIGIYEAFSIELFNHKYFSLVTDFFYIGKGSKTNFLSVTVDHLNNNNLIINEGESLVTKYNYLSFTPLLRTRFESEKITPYFIIGPRIDFQTSYKTDSDYKIEGQNKVLYGFNYGLGAEINISNLGFIAELQHNIDFSYVYNNLGVELRNKTFIAFLGIKLYLPQKSNNQTTIDQ